MSITPRTVWEDVAKIRETTPLVHNITNYVVMNTTANALLALGASPVMAHAQEEVADMVRLAGALVINIGTLSPHWVRAMHRAAQRASSLGVPIVLDPVGAGATAYRTETARALARETPPTIIRANASEIMAMVVADSITKGVDSTVLPEQALEAAQQLGRAYGCVVCVSGATDYITDGGRVIKVLNGHPMMPRVTGLGCVASALCGAFAAVNGSPLQATAHAMAVLGIAGERAAERAGGPGSLQTHLLDALYNLTEQQIAEHLRVEV